MGVFHTLDTVYYELNELTLAYDAKSGTQSLLTHFDLFFAQNCVNCKSWT